MVKCKICNREIKIKIKGKLRKQFNLCSMCMRGFYWKEAYKELKEETDRRFKLYDISIKNLIYRLNKYEVVIIDEGTKEDDKQKRVYAM